MRLPLADTNRRASGSLAFPSLFSCWESSLAWLDLREGAAPGETGNQQMRFAIFNVNEVAQWGYLRERYITVANSDVVSSRYFRDNEFIYVYVQKEMPSYKCFTLRESHSANYIHIIKCEYL